MKTRSTRFIAFALVIFLVVAGAAAWAIGYATYERLHSLHAPVFAADGQSIYYVRRRAQAFVIGFGAEFFTLPATVFLLSDHVTLERVALDSRKTETLLVWDRTPASGRRFDAYRRGAFAVFAAHLKPLEDGVRYELGITLHRVPMARHYVSQGQWPAAQSKGADWREGYTGSALDYDAMVKDSHELLVLPGNTIYPSGVVLYDHSNGTSDVLVSSSNFPERYRSAIEKEELDLVSQFAQVQRLREMRAAKERIEAGLKAQGVPEHSAALQTIKEMQKLGYYRKPTTLTARLLASNAVMNDGVPLVEITPEEFRFGIFPDIEKATAAPGEAIEKSMGDYIVHQDFGTSLKLNRLLDAGTKRFWVRTGRAVYEITIEKP
ncbi:MAG: hypothetical protein ACKVQA_16940 [Burkholderiales bacterium]